MHHEPNSAIAGSYEWLSRRRFILAALHVVLPMTLGFLYLTNVTISMNVIYSTTINNNGGAARVFLIALLVIWPYIVSAQINLRRTNGTQREFWLIGSALVISTVAIGLAIANGAGPWTLPALTVLQALLFRAVARSLFGVATSAESTVRRHD